MTRELMENIRTANSEFQEFIDQAVQDQAKGVASRRMVTRIDRINLRLAHVSKVVATESKPIIPLAEAVDSIRSYRETLKSLRAVLETLQFSLLIEKARLDSARANLHAACAWAASLRDLNAGS